MTTTDVYAGKDLGTLELRVTDEMVQHYIKGLDEPNCKSRDTCGWIVPKTGKQKPYCRTKAAPKKPAAAKDATPKDAPKK